MGATRLASGYFSAPSSLTPPLEVAFCKQGVSPYVSYRQGDQPCLNLCEKPRRQPYVTYVAYVLMSTAVSGTRADSPWKHRTRFITPNVVYPISQTVHWRNQKPHIFPTRDASPPLERAFGGSVGCLSLRALRQHISTLTRSTKPKNPRYATRGGITGIGVYIRSSREKGKFRKRNATYICTLISRPT